MLARVSTVGYGSLPPPTTPPSIKSDVARLRLQSVATQDYSSAGIHKISRLRTFLPNARESEDEMTRFSPNYLSSSFNRRL